MRLLISSIVFLTVFQFFACKEDPCATKEGFLQSFDTFITDYEAASANMDTTLRAEYDERFKGMVNTCYKKFKPDMSLEEKQEFWKKSLKYYMGKYEGSVGLELSAVLDDPFNQYIKDEVVELVKASGFTFLASLQEAVDVELPKLMEMFSSEIEKIGKEFLDLLGN